MLKSLTTLKQFLVREEKTRDTLHVLLSDTHTGSNHGLFLDRHWEGQEQRNHYPNSNQVKIRECFNAFADFVAQKRDGMKVRLVLNGDAIDGNHHTATDIFTPDPMEMADIHIEIMQEFQKRINWDRGDELYYVKGTQIHTGDMENYIGKHLNAVQDVKGCYAWDFLPLETNGVLSWFVHHGPGAGKGQNEGNALENWLKSIYFDAIKDGTQPPDIVYSGHVHSPTYRPFGYRTNGMEFKNMHGVILPSLQMKTRYANRVAPVSKNKIGDVVHEIKSDGTICIPIFKVMATE